MNIKPAKLRGEVSECMVLAADDGKNVALLEAEESKIGDEVSLEGFENNKELISFEEFKKIRIEVINGNVVCQTKHLKTNKETISVKGVKEKAIIS